MRIWDLHCHPSAFAQGATPEAAMQATLRFNDRMGVERMCIYLGVERSENPPPHELRAANDYVLRCMRFASDRVFGFAYVNPNYVRESLAEIERCIADGPMVGIKLWIARRCSDAVIDPIIRRAGELKAAIFQHTWFKVNGNQPGEPTPTDIAVLANRHRGVPLICGHTGGQWELGVRAVRAVKTISVDLAGSDPTAGFTEMAVRELGPDRIIWGSDAGGRSLASQLAKVHGARLTDEVKQKIFMGNLRNMLLPILEAKGIRA
ncbi:MAG: amidohydrolase family protein [Bryobacterales bacterium]|nr:amidohydrolase family protein [Bryobacterales bacterium]